MSDKNPNNVFTQSLREIVATARKDKVQLQHVVCELELVKHEILGDVIFQGRQMAAEMQAEQIIKSK